MLSNSTSVQTFLNLFIQKYVIFINLNVQKYVVVLKNYNL